MHFSRQGEGVEDASQHNHVAHGGPSRPEFWHAGPRESEILFSLKGLGLGAITGRVGRWRATVVVDLEQPSRYALDVVIDAGSLDTGESGRDDYARSPAFLDVERFPEMRFLSREIGAGDGGHSLTITGELTIKDVTREVRFVVAQDNPESLLAGESKLTFEGHISIRRRLDFGLRWQDEPALAAGDVVDVDLSVSARRGAK